MSDQIRAIARAVGRPRNQVVEDIKIYKKMRDDVAYFAKICFTKGEGWLYEPGDLAAYQQDVYDMIGEDEEKTLILIPRGHMKTTLVSKIYAIHQALFGLHKNIAVITASEQNQIGIANSHRDAIRETDVFEELAYFMPYFMLGKKTIIKANQQELVLGNRSRIKYRTITANLRGLNDGGRPSLVLLDDVLLDDAARSETVRDITENKFFQVVRFIGSADARIIAVGTVLHPDDIWSKIVDGRIGGWKWVKLRAYNPETWGDILWPERWTKEKLLKVYEEEYVADNKEYIWEKEMLNEAGAEQARPFANVVEELKYYEKSEYDGRIIYGDSVVSPLSLYRVVWIDHSQGIGSDDYIVLELGMNLQGITFVLSMHRANKDDLGERIAAVIKMLRKRKPHKIGIERTTESMTFIDALRSRMREAGFKYLAFDEATQREMGAKNDRIENVLWPRLREGTIVFPASGDIPTVMEDCLRRFDKTKKNNWDDPIDCLSLGMTRLRPPRPQEIVQDIPRDDLYRMRKRVIDHLSKPQYTEEEEAWPQVRGAC